MISITVLKIEFHLKINIKKFFSADIVHISTKFDLVTLIHSLEHIPDPLNYSAKVKSLLRPSG